MTDWVKTYRDWQGTAAGLAEAAVSALQLLGLETHSGPQPNERLVRHYVQLGILNRPRRQGREAVFGFHQLAQFLVGRLLAEDDWPLAKVAEFNQEAKLEDLLDLIPKSDQHPKKSYSLLDWSISKSSTRRVETPSDPQEWVEYIPLPWCRLLLDRTNAEGLDRRDLTNMLRAIDRVMRPQLDRSATQTEASVPVTRNLVLICDDQGVEPWLVRWLQQRAAAVVRTDTTEGAMDLLDRVNFDLVISDLGRAIGTLTDRREGLHLLQGIRERGLSLPVAIYTMNVSPSLNKLVRDAGADLVTADPDMLQQWLQEQGI